MTTGDHFLNFFCSTTVLTLQLAVWHFQVQILHHHPTPLTEWFGTLLSSKNLAELGFKPKTSGTKHKLWLVKQTPLAIWPLSHGQLLRKCETGSVASFLSRSRSSSWKDISFKMNWRGIYSERFLSKKRFRDECFVGRKIEASKTTASSKMLNWAIVVRFPAVSWL